MSTLIIGLGDSQFEGTDRLSNPFQDTLVILSQQFLRADYYRKESGGGTEYKYLVGNPSDVSVYNCGHGGFRLNQLNAFVSSQVQPIYNASTATRKIVLVEGGINDFYQGASVATVQTRLQTLVTDVRNACPSAEVWVFTIFGYYGMGDAGAIIAEANRITFNTWLRSNYSSFADGLIDTVPSTDLRLNDAQDSNYFQVDKTHLNINGAFIFAEMITKGLFGEVISPVTATVAMPNPQNVSTALGAAQWLNESDGTLTGASFNQKTYTPATIGEKKITVQGNHYKKISVGNVGASANIILNNDGSVTHVNSGTKMDDVELHPHLNTVGDSVEGIYYLIDSPVYRRYASIYNNANTLVLHLPTYAASFINNDIWKYEIVAGGLIKLYRIRAGVQTEIASGTATTDMKVAMSFVGATPANYTISPIIFKGAGVTRIVRKTATLNFNYSYPSTFTVEGLTNYILSIPSNTPLKFKISAIDEEGNESPYSSVVTINHN